VDVEAYHRTELRIALDGADSRRAMPSIAPGTTHFTFIATKVRLQ
jgi:hypothetical protein